MSTTHDSAPPGEGGGHPSDPKTGYGLIYRVVSDPNATLNALALLFLLLVFVGLLILGFAEPSTVLIISVVTTAASSIGLIALGVRLALLVRRSRSAAITGSVAASDADRGAQAGTDPTSETTTEEPEPGTDTCP